jgi:hypothetical protein
MILSLLFATLVFIPVVALVGVSPAGEALFGSAPSLTGAANVTMWSSAAVFGPEVIVAVVAGGGFLLAAAVIYSMKKAGLDKAPDRTSTF